MRSARPASPLLQQLLVALAACLALLHAAAVAADDTLAATITRVKPSIVGVGTYLAVRRPPAQLLGTGFVVGNGNHAATNHHVIDTELDREQREHLVVFIGNGRAVEYRAARIAAADTEHDLAVLAFDGAALPALELGDAEQVREGIDIAFTGFPIGAVLGLYPVTHQGIVSAITPIAIPAASSRQLTADKIAALRDPYTVLQLDATAYPGNSGSPVFLPADGTVVGIVNRVFVKGRKEDVLSDPSAITYAIPVRYLEPLINRR